jgi:acyl-phosphate glycerol 3-phosphate acyltransferase
VKPLFAVVFGYLIGSVLPAYLFGRARGLDLREHGTGNPGTTNAFGVLGALPGIATGFFDVSKSLLAMYFAFALGLSQPWMYAAGIAAVIGHRLPIWLHFRGGTGMASTVGLLLYAIGTAIDRGWLPLVWIVVLGVAAFGTWAVWHRGTVVGLVVMPLLFAPVALRSTDPLFTAFLGLSAGYIWVVQVLIARHQGLAPRPRTEWMVRSAK